MQDTTNDARLLTRSEVHSIFGLTQRYLEVSAVRGDGPPFIKINRSVRYVRGSQLELQGNDPSHPFWGG